MFVCYSLKVYSNVCSERIKYNFVLLFHYERLVDDEVLKINAIEKCVSLSFDRSELCGGGVCDVNQM